MSTLVKFLNQALHVALNPRTTPLTFVFGNEGGDIDSVVSAIYTALLLTKSLEEPTHIPVINFPREDLRLRGDVWSMLKEYGVTDEILLFEDQHLFLSSSSSPDSSSGSSEVNHDEADGGKAVKTSSFTIWPGDHIILTDHNVLRAKQRQWGPQVVGTIDHHADEHVYDHHITAYAEKIGNERPLKIIEPVGSATSLVALLWKEKENKMSQTGREGGEAPSAVLSEFFGTQPTATSSSPIPSPILLLSPIVQDTSNFKSSKNTPTDEAARDYLLRHIVAEASNPSSPLARSAAIKKIEEDFAKGFVSTDALAKHLGNLKEDIRGLTAPETLRRDYKKFEVSGGFSVGISAILLTKKQCRKLYAAAPSSSPLTVADEVDAEEEDSDIGKMGENAVAGSGCAGFPTDTNYWLPTIAARMEKEHLNVYMNMYNKKGRELEVIYKADDEQFAKLFEGTWYDFVSAHESSIGLSPKKKRFPLGIPTSARVSIPSSASAEDAQSNANAKAFNLNQIVYRQHVTSVSRKNFTPFLLNHFKKYFADETLPEWKSDL